jgi:hypothetical protein
MSKHVHSADPRKAAIVAALKSKSGGTKVTLLREVAPNTFTGSCLRQIRSACNPQGIARVRFETIGDFTVNLGDSKQCRSACSPTSPAVSMTLRAAGIERASRVELVGNEIDDALAAVELALEEKRKAHEAVKDQGFSERDFGIPQLEALEAKLEGAQS